MNSETKNALEKSWTFCYNECLPNAKIFKNPIKSRTKMVSRWDQRFLDLAKQIASWSKDPSRQIGAVIVGHNRQIIAQGYNGFPRGIRDDEDRYNDRETKYKYVVHAEANAIYNALANGAKLEGSTLYVTGLPVCHECAKAIIQTGIKRVVYDTRPDELWRDSSDLALSMFTEAGVRCEIKEPGSPEDSIQERARDLNERLKKRIPELLNVGKKVAEEFIEGCKKKTIKIENPSNLAINFADFTCTEVSLLLDGDTKTYGYRFVFSEGEDYRVDAYLSERLSFITGTNCKVVTEW